MSRQKWHYIKLIWLAGWVGGSESLRGALRYSEITVRSEMRVKKVLIWEINYTRASVLFRGLLKVSEFSIW